MNIWQFQALVSKWLLQWGIFSCIAGFFLRSGGLFWKGLGNQFIAWGAIDAAIAIGGQLASNNRLDQFENPGNVEVKQKEAKSLGRLLWINAVLDIFYVLGGLWWSKRDKGNGLGVLLQGAFLLIFDVYHALKLPKNHED
jgi:hypothetical protein